MIPKNIIYTYKSEKLHPLYEENLYLWKRFNYDFNFMFFSDDDMDNFIKKNYDHFYNFYMNLPRIVMKTDFFRLLAVYHYGGFYFDMDLRIIKNLSPLLDNELIFPFEHEMNIWSFLKRHRHDFDYNIHKLEQIGNYGFGAIKNHPFILKVVKNIINRFVHLQDYSDNDVLYFTGPDILNYTYWYNLNDYNFTILKGNEKEKFQENIKGEATWHKFGDFGEHLLTNLWTNQSDSDYNNYNYYDYKTFKYNFNENWNAFLKKTYPLIKDVKSKIVKESEYFAVLIEPRKHRDFEYIVKNMLFFLDDTWGLQIFCGLDNYQYVKNICKKYPKIHITQLEIKDFTRFQHSYLRKSITFWNKVKGSKQLFFQLDSILRKNDIDKFLKYDLVGAPWKFNFPFKVGNSGLSIIDKEKAKYICYKYYDDNLVDDLYYAKYFIKEGYNVANLETAKTFSVETIFYNDPYAIHKPWIHLSLDQVKILLDPIIYKNINLNYEFEPLESFNQFDIMIENEF